MSDTGSVWTALDAGDEQIMAMWPTEAQAREAMNLPPDRNYQPELGWTLTEARFTNPTWRLRNRWVAYGYISHTGATLLGRWDVLRFAELAAPVEEESRVLPFGDALKIVGVSGDSADHAVELHDQALARVLAERGNPPTIDSRTGTHAEVLPILRTPTKG